MTSQKYQEVYQTSILLLAPIVMSLTTLFSTSNLQSYGHVNVLHQILSIKNSLVFSRYQGAFFHNIMIYGFE